MSHGSLGESVLGMGTVHHRGPQQEQGYEGAVPLTVFHLIPSGRLDELRQPPPLEEAEGGEEAFGGQPWENSVSELGCFGSNKKREAANLPRLL